MLIAHSLSLIVIGFQTSFHPNSIQIPSPFNPHSQVGKTGAWLLLVRLIYDHIRAAQGVVVVNAPTPSSMFLESNPIDDRACTNSPPRDASTPRDSSLQQSRIISLEHLQRISREMQEDEKPALITIQDGSPKTIAQPSPRQGTNSTSSVRHTISLPVSRYIAYDYTHSCTECSKYLRGSPVAHAEILTSLLPMGSGGHVTIQQKHCVISPDRKMLERLKLQTLRPKTDKSFTHPSRPSSLQLWAETRQACLTCSTPRMTTCMCW